MSCYGDVFLGIVNMIIIIISHTLVISLFSLLFHDSHDVAAYLLTKPPDLTLPCPRHHLEGKCHFGVRCRCLRLILTLFSISHLLCIHNISSHFCCYVVEFVLCLAPTHLWRYRRPVGMCGQQMNCQAMLWCVQYNSLQFPIFLTF